MLVDHGLVTLTTRCPDGMGPGLGTGGLWPERTLDEKQDADDHEIRHEHGHERFHDVRTGETQDRHREPDDSRAREADSPPPASGQDAQGCLDAEDCEHADAECWHRLRRHTAARYTFLSEVRNEAPVQARSGTGSVAGRP